MPQTYRQLIEAIFDRWQYDARARQVFWLRWGADNEVPHTLRETATRLGFWPERVRQIVLKRKNQCSFQLVFVPKSGCVVAKDVACAGCARAKAALAAAPGHDPASEEVLVSEQCAGCELRPAA